MKLKLVSLEICPYVQRSVITLLEKGMDYEITYLSFPELKNPPSWFTDISPFGKVPVLTVGDTSVFESSVIMEYIDEVSPPSLHPAEPLQRALNRAWMKFGEELISSLMRYAGAVDATTAKQVQQEVEKGLDRLEALLGDGPYFNGQDFCLIDAAYATFFMRMDILEGQHRVGFYDNRPKLSRWADACRSRETVKNSVPSDLPEKYLAFIANMSEHAAKTFAKS